MKTFKDIKDGQNFSSNGIEYKKILIQDLKFFSILNVNAVSIVNGGLTYFNNDENVREV